MQLVEDGNQRGVGFEEDWIEPVVDCLSFWIGRMAIHDFDALLDDREIIKHSDSYSAGNSRAQSGCFFKQVQVQCWATEHIGEDLPLQLSLGTSANQDHFINPRVRIEE